MAKKSAPPAKLENTSQLSADTANPRKIGASAATGLSLSLSTFGDLSGIVFNQRTGQLVAGHQRVDQIRARYGDQLIECIDKANNLFGIRIDADHFFPVRVVDWSPAKQRAANVTANNHAISGEFTDSLESYLVDVKDQMESELGKSTLDELLLLDLCAKPEKAGTVGSIESVYQIIVECADEADQKKIYDKLQKQGLTCRVITL